jgi:hypothetical protein
MKVQIEFEIDNSAFINPCIGVDDRDPGAVASVLDYLSGKFASHPSIYPNLSFKIRDSNGNTIGQARVIG